jgi:hypothetical protein
MTAASRGQKKHEHRRRLNLSKDDRRRARVTKKWRSYVRQHPENSYAPVRQRRHVMSGGNERSPIGLAKAALLAGLLMGSGR